jgi:hypothetical protein
MQIAAAIRLVTVNEQVHGNRISDVIRRDH